VVVETCKTIKTITTMPMYRIDSTSIRGIKETIMSSGGRS